MVIPPTQFRDEEFFEPRKILQDEGASVVVASTAARVCRGMKGGSAQADISIADAKADDYVGLVLCGGNIDARVLSSILVRGLVRGGRLVRIRVEISDQPGALAKVARVIGEKGGNIVEIYHQRLFHDVPVKLAEVDAVLETRNASHVGEIVATLTTAGFPTRLLSSTAEG